jgi:predicted RNA-binding Zn-ribbon protein involved in translation (DUF1610 family)
MRERGCYSMAGKSAAGDLILCPECGVLPVIESEPVYQDGRHPRKKLYRYRCPSCGIVALWDASSKGKAIYEWNYDRRSKTTSGGIENMTAEPIADGAARDLPEAPGVNIKNKVQRARKATQQTANSEVSKAPHTPENEPETTKKIPIPRTVTPAEAARSSIQATQQIADPARVAEVQDIIGKMYTAAEIGAALQVTTRAIQGYIKSGTLIGKKIGGVWRVSADNLKKFTNGGE